MKKEYKQALERSATKKKKIQDQLFQEARADKAGLDEKFHKAHHSVFAEINCLDCANCCKTTSPIFEQADIDRIAKHLKIPTGKFITNYLYMDEEGDFVLHKAPCAFLEEDNKCSIYDVRPKACAEYPHTNRKRMYEILELTAENATVCPAVSKIVEQLKLD